MAQADTIGGNTNPASRECAGGVSVVDTAPAYTAPANGTITSFAFQSVSGSAGDRLAFKVFRPLGVDTYDVVGTTAVVTLATATDLETFTPAAPIAVQAGDMLGFWTDNAGLTGCGIDDPSNNSVFFAHGPNPGVGTTMPIPFLEREAHLNVSAQFTPTPSETTPPVISITTPADGAVFNLDSTVPADYACEDAESGIAFCIGPVPDGSPIDTGSLGAKSFEVNASNEFGLESSLTHDYTVRACLNPLPVGGPGKDVINGTPESDAADGGAGNDTIRGNESVDCLEGDTGNDRLEGDSGDDHLDGGDGFDRLFGHAGDETITANDDAARDTIVCGPGTDTVKASLRDIVAANCENVMRTAT